MGTFSGGPPPSSFAQHPLQSRLCKVLALALLAVGLEFVDIAAEAGLSVITYCGGATKDHILESTGNGVLMLDYDRDGFVDLYFVNAHRFPERPYSSVLYRNLGGGTFVDVTPVAGVSTTVFGQGGAVGDVDGDGLPDIYVTAFGENLLFRNNGDGTFSDWTDRAGVGTRGWSMGASFLDADGDGDQDLFVGSYLEATWDDVGTARRTRRWRGKVEVLDGPKGLPGATNTFYRNNGDSTFTDVTAGAGFDAGGSHYSMGVTTLDYDRDGAIDVYVANDSTPNGLYRNRGDGTFEEVGVETGAAFSADGNSQGSMGVDAADIDGDGFFDLVVTNFAHDYYSLYRNLDGALFLDASLDTGVALPSFAPLGWGTFFLDVDHDADLDLFFANGHIYPQVDDDPSLGESYRQRNQLLLNEAGRFHDVTMDAGPGFEVQLSSRGAAYGDLDNDGDLDIVVSNIDAPPTYLDNRGETSGHWVRFELVRALGARVEITAGGRTQSRQVVSGGSYASQSDPRLHFGLGRHATIDTLTVIWPDGTRQTHDDLSADGGYVVKQGQAPVEVP